MQREQHAPKYGGLTMVHLKNCKSVLSEHGRTWGLGEVGLRHISEDLVGVLLENPLW